MIKVFLLFTGIFTCLMTQSQTSKKTFAFQELKVGDTMYDLSLGSIINNNTGKSRFSEFKGKLVILDFWNSFCASCIEGFPKMAAIQQKFGEQVQVILVNPDEDAEVIKKRLKLSSLNDIIPKNIPVIVDAKDLVQLFPTKGETGYHVWIDKDGVIRLRGNGFLNTNESKIYELLSGSEISFVTDEGLKAYDGKSAFFHQSDDVRSKLLLYNSAFARFSDHLAPYFGTYSEAIDSTSGTIRATWLNLTILELFNQCTETSIQDNKVLMGKQLMLFVTDSSLYTDKLPWFKNKITDEVFRKSRWCYEQVSPLSLRDSMRMKLMLDDLNKYFMIEYGAIAIVEEREMPCYVLRKFSPTDKLATRNHPKSLKRISENGTKMISYTNYSIKEIFEDLNRAIESVFPESNNSIVVDETDYKGNVDLKLPDPYRQMVNAEALKRLLQPYGLEVVKGVSKVKMLIIKEKEYQ